MSEGRSPEDILFELLVIDGNIEQAIMANLPAEAISNEDLRPIYLWMLDYYKQSSRRSTPTVDVLKNTQYPGQPGKTMYAVLSEYEIFLDEDPAESIEWVISQLKGRLLTEQATVGVTRMLQALSTAHAEDRPDVLSQHADNLVGLALAAESRVTRVDFREDVDELLAGYEDRKANVGQHMGMHFGLPDIDSTTYGIHDGELAVVAAGPKTGKSFFLDWVALKEWENGRNTALFTLENSIAMTEGRIACLATGADSERWMKGLCDPDEEAAITDWLEEMRASDTALHILQPSMADRTAESIITKARLLNVDSIIIDQLTFIEAQNVREPRHVQIRDIMHTIKVMVSSGHKKLPCLVAHQVNREGVKAAEKDGKFAMYHMAEGSEVERTADWVFSMFQSGDYRALNRLLFQTLASRRAVPVNWELNWDMGIGNIDVIGAVNV